MLVKIILKEEIFILASVSVHGHLAPSLWAWNEDKHHHWQHVAEKTAHCMVARKWNGSAAREELYSSKAHLQWPTFPNRAIFPSDHSAMNSSMDECIDQAALYDSIIS
jgi:hypothetical protein